MCGSVSVCKCNVVAMIVTALAPSKRPTTTSITIPFGIVSVDTLPLQSNYTIIYDLLLVSLQVEQLFLTEYHTSYTFVKSHFVITMTSYNYIHFIIYTRLFIFLDLHLVQVNLCRSLGHVTACHVLVFILRVFILFEYKTRNVVRLV